MARDFRRNTLELRCLVVNSLCSGVLSCALECSPVLETLWRRPKSRSSLPTPREEDSLVRGAFVKPGFIRSRTDKDLCCKTLPHGMAKVVLYLSRSTLISL